jgi:hypothetical protein
MGFLIALAAGGASGADDPARFEAVPEWRGSLQITGSGSGQFGPANELSYQAHAFADLPLVLVGFPRGSPINLSWTACVANYVDSLDVRVSATCDSGTSEFTTVASGPFVDLGGGCPLISLDIFSSLGDPPSGWMVLPDLAFDGTEHLVSSCPDTDETYPIPVGVYPAGAVQSLMDVPLPDTGLHIHAVWSFSDALPHPEWGAAIVESSAATAEDLYKAACVSALSAQIVPDDAPRAAADAGHAVRLLREAAAKGFTDATHVKTDSDLHGLRSREDFEQFIKELDAGSNKRKDQRHE